MKKSKLIVYLILLTLILALRAAAQNTDSLLNTLNSSMKFNKVEATFKSPRLVLSQSTETQKKHDLDLVITHRFGDIGGNFGSSHTLYGLDVATDLYIGFDYGITNNLTVGIGRSKHDELYNLFIKHKILQQTNDGIPLNITLLLQGAVATRTPFANEFISFNHRTSYLIQPIISRKFSERLSLQAIPSYLIRYMTTDILDSKNLFTIGFAGRFKITKRLSFIVDYTLINGLSRPTRLSVAQYNPLGVGLEIETGGHVFSLNFINAEYINENNFLTDTKKSWKNGGVRFGFSISRNFSLFKSKNPDIKSTIY
ncbi:DUF5777 family beta-barrel protein [Pedobacter montanisoli]|uniref:DUF5777 family beta-barrel protein n=1 Tax=Pedobacter montanisoli TaxID=2923277 RepID=A0ABS9ZUA2_9SPHI|nr:DUF5777 family beta-barrel protein [Pedobacter montanisoli]MCJ0742181.1 DUF5777 family beta-barrel protein [Pedobacter montanisoli]